jgi:DNA-binding transcriptional LysR family regulator
MTIGPESTTGLYAFVRAVEAGSFSAAARIAGTTPSAVSKSVERLEQRLGVKLFLRSTRSLALTVDGTAYYERVAPLLRALDDAGEVLSGAARGLLRVSLPGVLGPALVESITRDFMPRHPEIRIEISITDRHVDLVREGYDVALRVGEVADVDWMVRRLATLPLILVAAPEWLGRVGPPATREALAGLPHIRYRFGARAYPIRFADGSELRPDGVLDTDSGRSAVSEWRSFSVLRSPMTLRQGALSRCFRKPGLRRSRFRPSTRSVASPRCGCNSSRIFSPGCSRPIRFDRPVAERGAGSALLCISCLSAEGPPRLAHRLGRVFLQCREHAPRGESLGERSEVPEGGDPAEGVAIDGNAPDRREGEVRGDEIFAAHRGVLQKTNAYTNRFLGIMFKAVVPIWVVEADREQGIAGEGQPLAA